jgi:hypothetical protein
MRGVTGSRCGRRRIRTGRRSTRWPTRLIRHRSAVELADRAQDAGLIARRRDRDQHSQVRLTLTGRGGETLQELSETHLRELAQLAPAMHALWDLSPPARLGEPAPGRPQPG